MAFNLHTDSFSYEVNECVKRAIASSPVFQELCGIDDLSEQDRINAAKAHIYFDDFPNRPANGSAFTRSEMESLTPCVFLAPVSNGTQLTRSRTCIGDGFRLSGRIEIEFLVCIPDDFVDQGTVTPAGLLAWESIVSGIIMDLESGTNDPCAFQFTSAVLTKIFYNKPSAHAAEGVRSSAIVEIEF